MYLSPGELRALAVRQSIDPFPHAVVDDFLPVSVADALAAAFPGVGGVDWDIHHDPPCPEAQYKLVCQSEAKFPAEIREALWFLHSETLVHYLEDLMGVSGLLVDPTHRGCGMHSTGRGGYVGIHSDSSRHPDRRLDQRLNLILWLNPGWREEWGGHLELWDREGMGSRVKIAPLHNRVAIFETGTSCYHGHPYRLLCPEDRRRNSLAVYYYEVGRPVDGSHGGWREAPHFLTKEPA